MIDQENQAVTTARDYVTRFGELALFRIEDEIGKAAVRHEEDELALWLKVRVRAHAMLDEQERCLSFGHRPRH